MLCNLSKVMRLFIFTGILSLSLLSSLHAGEDEPFITNDEEYAVIAAVFFHKSIPPGVNNTNEPTRKNDLFRNNKRLSGIPSSHFSLSRLTSEESLPDKGLDRTMIDDFNRKNVKAYQIDPDKFAAATKGSGVALITPKRFSMDEEPRGIRSGITYISRPGFNKTGTEAVLNVSHVADPEMGIGYMVILEKSPQDGKWYIVDAVVNRRY